MRDIETQRGQAPQRPHSDVYMQGVPPKRRKVRSNYMQGVPPKHRNVHSKSWY
ncbi:hypothetical protein DPMN_147763 [Dreissena polymorpha]|uniref:Uncharacterized protein n=1 Tax=Dreissena polymorpha TaxID=45954 RepID=A0A9D4F9L2_DREPO|nr:hypothetical protein DPMN_147763 [Dreissena polymorpha]